jgi:hypothetical protein
MDKSALHYPRNVELIEFDPPILIATQGELVCGGMYWNKVPV